MICFDREQPESARILMLKGAESILTPNACGLDELRLDQIWLLGQSILARSARVIDWFPVLQAATRRYR